MLGIFDLNFKFGDQEENVRSINHLTNDGLKALFHLQRLPQPNVTAAGYPDNINYFFIITEHQMPVGFNINDRDVKFAQIAGFPCTYNQAVRLDAPNDALADTIGIQNYPDETKTVKILGAGAAYHEVGGDGSKDFVWSITPLKTPLVLKPYDWDLPETEDNAFTWQCSYAYTAVLAGNHVPEIKFNVDGEDYTFIRDPKGVEGRAKGYAGNNLMERRPTSDSASFTINGARFCSPFTFKEIPTDQPLIRRFEISYKNRRDANPVDLTGFQLSVGANYYSWRLEHGRYIVLPAGKTFKITVDVGMENGITAGIVYNNLDYAPTPYYESELGEVSTIVLHNLLNVKIDTVYLTGSAGKSNEFVNIKKLVGDENFVYVSDLPTRNVYNTELSKLELAVGGRKGRPTYILTGGNPSVVDIDRIDVSAVDTGFHYQNNRIEFRINVPADITHLQCALDDGVWFEYPVTAGEQNTLVLDKRFFYNAWMFIRWRNGDKTGIISQFNKPLNNRSLIVEPSFIYVETINGSNPQCGWYYRLVSRALGHGCKTIWNTEVPWLVGEVPLTTSGNASERTTIGTTDVSTDYSGTWPAKTVKIAPELLYMTNDFRLVTEPSLAPVPVKADGDVSVLPWQYNPTRPNVSDVPVAITPPNIPRTLQLALKPYPTAEAPSIIRIQATSQTRRARIRRLHDNQVIAVAESPLVGQLLEFKVTEKLMNHLDYGVEYIDASDVSLSPSPVVFRGGSLDVPAQITDYAYDDVAYIISFTTPDRAVRASIKQFGIEVFSFECVQGGVTKFYMSKPLNMTQRYELWCYNANGETWDEPYVMVDVDENDEKPTSTGPYLFPEWANPEPTDVVTDLNGDDSVFADVHRWVREGMVFDAYINGQKTDKLITRNSDGLIMSIRFNAGMQAFIWRTGYAEGQTSYDLPPVNNSYVSVLYMTGTTPFRIDVWHVWEKYSYINEATYGRWKQGPAFVPYYGQTKGKFQKTEIVTGYIRNTLRILYKPTSQPRVCPMYHLQPDNYSNSFRSASIYLHLSDIVGSLNINKTNTGIEQVQPIIDGKTAKWEYTRNDNQMVEGIIRCFNNDQIAFRFDTANPSNGWVCENFDPELEGQPGSDLIYHTLEFCANDTDYWGASIMSYSAQSLSADKPGNADGEFGQYRYSQAIFAKVNPYAPKQSFDTEFGTRVSVIDYWENNPSSVNREDARFRDAFTNVDNYETFATKVEDSYHYINDEKATLSRAEVTLTYKPSATGNIGFYYNRIDPNGNWSYQEPTLEPFTYNALIITTPSGIVVSNRTNPFVWTIDFKPPTAPNLLKIVFGRKQFTEDYFAPYQLVSSENTVVSGGVFHSQLRKYWAAMTIVLHNDVQYRLLKTESDRPDPASVEIDESKSRWDNKVLHKLIGDLANNGFIWDDANMGYTPVADLLDPTEDFIFIDGRPFTIQFNPAIMTDLALAQRPYQRDLTIYACRIVDAADANIYFEADFLGNMKIVGLTPGIHRISFGTTVGAASWMLPTCQSFTASLVKQGKMDLGLTIDEYGFVEISAFNYIVSDVATGSLGSVSLMPITILDPATKVNDFTPDFGPSFLESAQYQQYVDLVVSTNPYFGTVDEQPLDIKLNGVRYDSSTTFTDTNIAEEPPEGEKDRWDRSDLTLLLTRLYVWEEARVVLRIEHYPENSRIYIHLDSTDTDLKDPVETFTGDQMHFEILAMEMVKWGTPWAFSSLMGTRQTQFYGLPVGSYNNPQVRVQSVANGDEIWSRMEIVIGQAPIVDEDMDPSIGPSYYTNTEMTYLWNSNPNTVGNGISSGGGPMFSPMAGPIPPGPVDYPFAADMRLIPNWVQFPYTRFEVIVNGVVAKFIAPKPFIDPKFSDVRFDRNTEFAVPRYMGEPQTAAVDLRRFILKDGTLEPLGDIPNFYDKDFVGPGGGSAPMFMAMAAALNDDVGPPNPTIPEEDIAGVYIADIDPAIHLDKNYEFGDVPAIIVGDYDVVIIWNPMDRDWVLYTGDQTIPYFIEFRYKRPWLPSNEQASIAIDAENMNQRNFFTNFEFLTANNVRVETNEEKTDHLNISWVNMVLPGSLGPVGGWLFKGLAVPRAPKLRPYYPAINALDQSLFRLAVWNVADGNIAITINDVPAVIDLTNYTAEDKDFSADITYFVTETAAENEYPALGSKGNFTAKTAETTVRYDVATGTWAVTETTVAPGTPIDVGIVTMGAEAMSGGRNSSVYHVQYQDHPGWTNAYVFSLYGTPGAYNPADLVLESLTQDFTSFMTKARDVIFPNYELFDLKDFELRANDVVITPEVEVDTHNVPVKYKWVIDASVNFSLEIDIANRIMGGTGPDIEDPLAMQEYGLLPMTRTDKLSENRDTKYFLDQIAVVLEWRYKPERDILDPRPLWLGTDNSTGIEHSSMDSGITSYTLMSGNKKVQSVACALVFDEASYMNGNGQERLFHGYMPTQFTGSPFTVENNLQFVADSKAAKPLTGPIERDDVEWNLSANGRSNYEPS